MKKIIAIIDVEGSVGGYSNVENLECDIVDTILVAHRSSNKLFGVTAYLAVCHSRKARQRINFVFPSDIVDVIE